MLIYAYGCSCVLKMHLTYQNDYDCCIEIKTTYGAQLLLRLINILFPTSQEPLNKLLFKILNAIFLYY